jgi:hypothetical protein
MPQAFENCVSGGGKVITKRVNDTEYMHICFPKGGGASVAGEVKKYKKLSRSKSNKA